MRHEFPASVKKAALLRAGGRCEASGVRYGLPPGTRCTALLSETGVHLDHYPRGAHDPHPDTRSLGNCVVTCPKCNLYAAHNFDTPFEAKLKRSLRKRGLGTKPPKTKARVPQPANHKWPKRGFGK